MKNYKENGGITISKNTNKALWIVLFASLILALFSCAGATPGIWPNYYGPFEANPIGQSESCENMMTPGTYEIYWAHGSQSDWDWQYFDTFNLEANMKYVLTYDSRGELSIDESQDSSLTGYTVICGRNNGPDALVLSLKP